MNRKIARRVTLKSLRPYIDGSPTVGNLQSHFNRFGIGIVFDWTILNRKGDCYMYRYMLVVFLLCFFCFVAELAHADVCGRRTAVQWGGPQTRTRCIGYASGRWPWGKRWKTCDQWATDLEQHSVDVVAYCPANRSEPAVINRVVDGCIGAAWVSSIGSVYLVPTSAFELITGRLSAFDQVFTSCVAAANVPGGVVGYQVKVERNNFW
jgi:hypothetical protein